MARIIHAFIGKSKVLMAESLSIDALLPCLAANFSSRAALIVSALANGVAVAFVAWFLLVRNNRRSRRKLRHVREAWNERPKPKWLTEVEVRMYAVYVNLRQFSLPRGREADPEYSRTLTHSQRQAVLRLDPRVRAKATSRAEQARRYMSVLWRRMQRRQAVLWTDNFEQHRYGVNPRHVHLSFNGCVGAILWTHQLDPFPGLPSLGALVDSVPTVAANIKRSAKELLSWCMDTVAAALTRDLIRVPLDVRRSGVRTPQWLPLFLAPHDIGSILGLFEVVRTAQAVQEHTRFTMPVLMDLKPYYSILKRVYGRTFEHLDVAAGLTKIPLLFGTWHAYKQCVIQAYRSYMPILALLEQPSIRTNPEDKFRTKPKLHHMEAVFASLLLCANALKGPLDAALERAPRARGERAHGLHILQGLKTLLFEHVPALFLIGHLVRECGWNSRDNGTGRHSHLVVQYAFLVMISLCREHAHKVEYVRSMATALLSWLPWNSTLPGVVYDEEFCEALLSRLAALVIRYPTATDPDALMDLFLTVKTASMGEKDIKKCGIPLELPRELYEQVIRLISTCTSDALPFTRWTNNDYITGIEQAWDVQYKWPHSVKDIIEDDTLVHDILLRSLQVLSSATAPADQHMDMMSTMFQNVNPETLQGRRNERSRLNRMGVPSRFRRVGR